MILVLPVPLNKLVVALDISPAQCWEGATMVGEGAATYKASRMLPVITAEQMVFLNVFPPSDQDGTGHAPSLSADAGAFFLQAGSAIIAPPVVSEGDLLLVEPGTRIEDGDMVILLKGRSQTLGRLFRTPSGYILQLLAQGVPPLSFPSARKTMRDIRLLRISEIRNKI